MLTARLKKKKKEIKNKKQKRAKIITLARLSHFQQRKEAKLRSQAADRQANGP